MPKNNYFAINSTYIMRLDNLLFTPNSARTLKWWVLLPQITTHSDGEKIPALIGNLKTFTIPTIMVVLTILLEAALMFDFNNQGVNFITLLGLSIFDFVIAFLPIILLLSLDLIPSKKYAERYEIKIKLKYLHLHTKVLDKEAERFNLQQDLKKIERALIPIILIEVVCILIILGFAAWKYLTYYNVFGYDFLVLPIGRFTLIVIIVSTITHIFFTKNLISYIICKASFNKEINQRHQYSKENIYHETEINYNNIEYRPAESRGARHFIGQKVEKELVEDVKKEGFIVLTVTRNKNNKSNEEENNKNVNQSYYRTNNFIGTQNICLLYQDYLKDPEITDLYINQNTREARETIISITKEIQKAYV